MIDRQKNTDVLSATIIVNASRAEVFELLTNWRSQSKWILGTSVEPTTLNGNQVGVTLSAFTGICKLGFTDTMVITLWDPPRRCSVEHTGKIVQGSGDFIVSEYEDSLSMFTWSENMIIPFGILGRILWILARPLAKAGLWLSLRRFKSWVEKQG